MGNYVISCCSTADLSKDHFDAIDVKYICFHFELDGKQYEDNLGVSIPFDDGLQFIVAILLMVLGVLVAFSCLKKLFTKKAEAEN